MKKIIALFTLFVPTLAQAHEQWFAGMVDPNEPLPDFYTHWSALRVAMVVAGVFAIALSWALNEFFKKWKVSKKISAWMSQGAPLAPQFVRATFGILLIVGSLTGVLFAPDLHLQQLPLPVGITVWILQYLVGFALVLGVFTRTASVIALVMFALTFVFFPLRSLLGYIGFVGAFLYLLIVGSPTTPQICKPRFFVSLRKWLDSHKSKALPLMRVLLGVSLIAMAIVFKLTTPQITLAAMAGHNVNFMSMMGLTWFTNDMFVFAAGLCELIFGVLLMLNILPRIVSLKLFGLFFVTIFSFGIAELFGHLPLFAIFFAIATEEEKYAE